MRAALLAVFLAMVASQARAADYCNNQVSCEGKLQTQILGAYPIWTAKLNTSCSTLLYAGYPHCAQIVWDGVPIPWITFLETDVTPGGQWLNHSKAPKHRPNVTPDAVLAEDQENVTPVGAVLVHEKGDVRGGEGVGWWVEFHVCMQEAGGANQVARYYRRGYPWGADGWFDGDLTKCAAD